MSISCSHCHHSFRSSVLDLPILDLDSTFYYSAFMEKEIHMERTSNSDLMDFVLLGKAGKILPSLVEGWV